jgi:hypothetical protein
LSGGEKECIDPDAMDGSFAILAGSGAHEEPSFWNGDEAGLDWRRRAELRVRMSRHGFRSVVARFEPR